MRNNFWEEQNMAKDILNFHEDKMNTVGLPLWAKKINCPFCNLLLPPKSIRHISVCFNTRNFGDVSVEFLCNHCQIMDTMYFRKEIKHIKDFACLILGEKQTKSDPVVEESMYKIQYNNIIEEMLNRGEK